jgi:hypothetical protein
MVKGKVIPVLNYHEDILDTSSIAPPLLTSTLDGGEWSTSRHGRFTAGERAHGTQLERRPDGRPAGNRTPAVQPVARRSIIADIPSPYYQRATWISNSS